jgi:hypothetical protein
VLLQNHCYFSREELYETARNVKFDNTPRKDTHIYKSGASYTGQWRGGLRHGFGVMIWNDSSEFIGQWNYGMPAGYGKFTHVDGDEFEGKWMNPYIVFNLGPNLIRESIKGDIMDGFSKVYTVWLWQKYEKAHPYAEPRLTFSPKHLELIRTLQDKLRAINLEITKITGHLNKSFTIDNIKKSFLAIDDDLGHYLGELKGLREGLGKNIYPNGDIYEGYWKSGYHHGIGRHQWKDGSTHIGYYKMDNKQGVGKYTWDEHTQYTGEFSNNVFNGVGEYLFDAGQVYMGEWLDGKMHGFGVFTSGNGIRYEGTWFSGKLNGDAYTVYPDGTCIKNRWEHGELVKISDLI